jgi:hypothetical protein
MSLDLIALIELLSKERPLFHSEADFQHALGWALHRQHPSWDVRLELPVALDESSPAHVDIWARDGRNEVAIELKYKTAALRWHSGDEPYALKSHAAQDLGRYDFIKDIVRLEKIVAHRPRCSGWAVFLTNVRQYWRPARSTNSVDRAFRLNDERKLTGSLAWDARAAAGTVRTREHTLALSGTYALAWRDYAQIDSTANGQFRFLAVPVAPSLTA